MRLNKKELEQVESFVKGKRLEDIILIINQLLTYGIEKYQTITIEDLEENYKNQLEEEKALEQEHKIKLISPEYEKFIHLSCKELANQNIVVRNYIIKKYI